MTPLVALLALSLAQPAQSLSLADYLPLRAGETYSYWVDFGLASDSLEMRVTEVGADAVVVDGFPTPQALAAGGAAGGKVTLRLDVAAGTVSSVTDAGPALLLSLPPDAHPGPVSTWRADFPEALWCPLATAPPLKSASALLAKGVGLAQIRFETDTSKGEYTLVRWPAQAASERAPDLIAALQPNTVYRYICRDVAGQVPAVCEVGAPVDVLGVQGVAVRGLPWYGHTGLVSAGASTREVAIDVAGRRWVEKVGGRGVELFRLNVAPCAEPVTVPAGRYAGCSRVTSVSPGFSAILEPRIGLIRWEFATMAGPVTYELESVVPGGSEPPSTAPPKPGDTGPTPAAPPTSTTAPGAQPAPPTTPGSEPPTAPGAGTPTPAVAPAGPPVLAAVHGRLVLALAGVAPATVAEPDGPVVIAAASIDGRRAAWGYLGPVGLQLMWAQRDDSGWHSSPLVQGPVTDVHDLQWSSDGGRLVYTVGREMRVFDAGTRSSRALGLGSRPGWISADTLLYESGRQPGDEEVGILRVSVDGGGGTMVVPWAYDLAASGDGAVLAYAYPLSSDDPHLCVVESGRETAIVGSTKSDSNPALSMDGRYLAWVRMGRAADGKTETYSVRVLDRGAQTETAAVSDLADAPVLAFCPDGSLLVHSGGLSAKPARCWRPGTPAAAPVAVGGDTPEAVWPVGVAARIP